MVSRTCVATRQPPCPTSSSGTMPQLNDALRRGGVRDKVRDEQLHELHRDETLDLELVLAVRLETTAGPAHSWPHGMLPCLARLGGRRTVSSSSSSRHECRKASRALPRPHGRAWCRRADPRVMILNCAERDRPALSYQCWSFRVTPGWWAERLTPSARAPCSTRSQSHTQLEPHLNI